MEHIPKLPDLTGFEEALGHYVTEGAGPDQENV